MNRLLSIYQSFRRLHPGTQAWMMLALGPGIFLPLFAMNGPLGPWVATLSILGFAPAPFIIWKEAGFSLKLGLAHVVFWPPLLALLAWHFASHGFTGGTAEVIYLINAAILSISLLFDIRDARRWLTGARAVA
ncbi:hypothetical protein KUV51_19500 [Tateyamaria omphalii]|uniref:hypothetical protein n=1 Tax=Tateyamaria omphalii TaxID=299262 RepID=UPI001C99C4CF|nr:hypothetical protein [Tateyamaria omphalii]MBY5935201.1 hypothetical protein [Tateyamaria omphalii]